jgi:hypothetical protein
MGCFGRKETQRLVIARAMSRARDDAAYRIEVAYVAAIWLPRCGDGCSGTSKASSR